MNLSHADILKLPPAEAERELVDMLSKLPLYYLRARGGGPEDELMSVAEVARRLGKSESFVRMQAASSPLWAGFTKKIGSAWRFKRAEFERIVSEGKSRELL